MSSKYLNNLLFLTCNRKIAGLHMVSEYESDEDESDSD